MRNYENPQMEIINMIENDIVTGSLGSDEFGGGAGETFDPNDAVQ